MRENSKNSNRQICCFEALLSLVVLAGSILWCYFKGIETDILLRNSVIILLLLCLTDYVICCYFLSKREEQRYEFYFFLIFQLLCFLIIGACQFLPFQGWPFLFVFFILTVFSAMDVGLITASSYLLIAILLSGEVYAAFIVYFISGMMICIMFKDVKNDFQIALPLLMSLFCLLVCETACFVVLENSKLHLDTLIVPFMNMIISGMLIWPGLKIYSAAILYRYRDKYQEINDTSYDLLAELKSSNKRNYMISIHTSYFCERIANKLLLDTEAMKGAGYYHLIRNKSTDIFEERKFPPQMQRILDDYQNRKKGISMKESAVLYCANGVISAIMFVQENKERQVDIDKLIDALFAKWTKEEIFSKCDITFAEVDLIRATFKEEKLYYDFLH